MSDASFDFQKRQLTVDPVIWTAVVPPIDCSHINIRNISGVTIKLRTDSGNPQSEDTILSRTQDGATSSYPFQGRFPAGQAAFYLLSTSGAQTVVVTYLR